MVPVDDHADLLKPEERTGTAGFAPRRMRTYSSGRLAARRALAAAGCAEGPIGVLASGAPAVPEGWRLSISHTDHLAVAIVCSGDQAKGIGVDIEQTARMDLALRRHVVRPADRVPAEAGALHLTATFSLRESLFKALGGQGAQGSYIRWDGDAVEIGVEGAGLPLRYGWTVVGGHVLTFCALGA